MTQTFGETGLGSWYVPREIHQRNHFATHLHSAHKLHRTISLDLAIVCLTEQSDRAQGFNFPDNGKITFIDALHLGHGLRKNGINEVEEVLLKKIKEVETSNNRVLLVLDGIDFLLAATEARLDEILSVIWELREVWRQPLCWSIYTTNSTLTGSPARACKYCLHVGKLSTPASPAYFTGDQPHSFIDESSTSSQNHMGRQRT